MTEKREYQPMGENSGVDVSRVIVPAGNRVFRRNKGHHTEADMGEELGYLPIDDARLGISKIPGMVTVYIRKKAEGHEPELITTVVAAGVIIGAIAALKHHRKSQ